jgi:hypothetical protein
VEVYSGYAAYQCVAGFELWGSPVQECLEIGQWADIDAYCYGNEISYVSLMHEVIGHISQFVPKL